MTPSPFPPWSGLFDSPQWGEGGGEGVKKESTICWNVI
jgi:hypothetical protein